MDNTDKQMFGATQTEDQSSDLGPLESLLFEGDHSTWDPSQFEWDPFDLTASSALASDTQQCCALRQPNTTGGTQLQASSLFAGPSEGEMGQPSGGCCSALRSMTPPNPPANQGIVNTVSAEPSEEEMSKVLETLMTDFEPSPVQISNCDASQAFPGDLCSGQGGGMGHLTPSGLVSQTQSLPSPCNQTGSMANGTFVTGINTDCMLKKPQIAFPWEMPDVGQKAETVVVQTTVPCVAAQANSIVPLEQQAGDGGLEVLKDYMQKCTGTQGVQSCQPQPCFSGMNGMLNGCQAGVGMDATTPRGQMGSGISTPGTPGEKEGGHSSKSGDDVIKSFPEGVPVLASDTSRMGNVCQVPGCGKSLDGLKEYHQRYKICDVHIKLPQVVKQNRLQRFCQQCGRFHDLSAFDANRRSCRDQLSKHNARRRKRTLAKMQAANDEHEPANDESDAGKLLQCLLKNPHQLRALKLLLGLQTHNALPLQNPMPAPYSSRHHDIEHSANGKADRDALMDPPADGTSESCHDPETYDLARKVMHREAPFGEVYTGNERILRLSMKLFGITPANLPENLKDDITAWLGQAPKSLEGVIRPGCVFLTVEMAVDRGTYQTALEHGVESLMLQLINGAAAQFWSTIVMVVQLGLELALVRQGRCQSFYGIASCPKCLLPAPPQIHEMSKACVNSNRPSPIAVVGSHLGCANCQMICRANGKHVRLPQPCLALTEDTISFVLPPAPGTTVLSMEVCCGAVLSELRVLLMTPDEALNNEINWLCSQSPFKASLEITNALLKDLGMVLQHMEGTCLHQDTKRVLAKASSLLILACDFGCVRLASKLLSSATVEDLSAANLLSMEHGGLSLMHRGVRSGKAEMAQILQEWGERASYPWSGVEVGPMGLTPLHLSALLEDDGLTTLALLSTSPLDAYTTTHTRDGVTPFHLAMQMGHYPVDKIVEYLVRTFKNPKRERSARRSCDNCDSNLPPLLLNVITNCDHGKNCEHVESCVYSITAMCQTCHTNQVLLVS